MLTAQFALQVKKAEFYRDVMFLADGGLSLSFRMASTHETHKTTPVPAAFDLPVRTLLKSTQIEQQ